MPLKFKVPDFEKFDGTTCPSAHLTMYCRKMYLFLDNEKLLIHCFQDSLVGSAARWSRRIRGGNDSRKYSKKRENEVNTTSSYVPGHSTGIVVGQPNHVAAPAASAQSSSKPESRGRGERKEKPTFTPIPIRYEELFPKLVESRLVAPRYIAPIQPPYPPWFNPNVKCDYHAGNPSHYIDNCTAFKYVVEQLLKARMLSFEAPEKNPMPNQKGLNAVTEGNNRQVKESLSDVIAPMKWVWERNVKSLNDVQAMMDNKELEFFIKGYDCGSEDVCASEDAPIQGNFTGCKPLVIKVSSKGTEVTAAATSGFVIKTPGAFHTKTVNSGRCYSAQPEVEPSKNQKGKTHVGEPVENFNDETEPEYHEPVKETEAKEFLKILKHTQSHIAIPC
ncbi:hypothetical protein V6N13_092832 [Hibiscus sabdariffa]